MTEDFIIHQIESLQKVHKACYWNGVNSNPKLVFTVVPFTNIIDV